MSKMKLLFLLLLTTSIGWAQTVQYKYPLPRDVSNAPIYGGYGIPAASAVSVTGSSYDDNIRATVPQSGNNAGRTYRSIAIYNPDTARTVYACFGVQGAAASCLDMMIVPPGVGIVLDGVMYGYVPGTNSIFLRLDSSGSVQAQVTQW